MDVKTIPHAMYFSGSKETIAKINQVPYLKIEYDDKGMFQAKLMDNTQVQIFMDNGATPSILPYRRWYESHFWIEIPLKLDNQVIQIKTLVCDSECPYDIVLGHTSLAQLMLLGSYTYNKFLYH